MANPCKKINEIGNKFNYIFHIKLNIFLKFVMLSYELCNALILTACALGLLWAIINAFLLSKIRFDQNDGYQNFNENSDPN